jgi:hypothetical protein
MQLADAWEVGEDASPRRQHPPTHCSAKVNIASVSGRRTLLPRGCAESKGRRPKPERRPKSEARNGLHTILGYYSRASSARSGIATAQRSSALLPVNCNSGKRVPTRFPPPPLRASGCRKLEGDFSGIMGRSMALGFQFRTKHEIHEFGIRSSAFFRVSTSGLRISPTPMAHSYFLPWV